MFVDTSNAEKKANIIESISADRNVIIPKLKNIKYDSLLFSDEK